MAIRKHRALLTEINIVPLTDVVLVLLIIFMVTTPFLFEGALNVSLPKVRAAAEVPPKKILITLTADGALYADGRALSLTELPAYIAARLKQDAGLTAVIQADREVSHGRVVTVLSAIYEGGLTKVGIGVEWDASPPVEDGGEKE